MLYYDILNNQAEIQRIEQWRTVDKYTREKRRLPKEPRLKPPQKIMKHIILIINIILVQAHHVRYNVKFLYKFPMNSIFSTMGIITVQNCLNLQQLMR